ncbi:Excision repair cross-complementation group 1 [Bulinus truncatus]|nr:Excision repair cross-complementation group 1 [Bulinus truncatus]
MAGQKKFVVPSLEDMESARKEDPPEGLFRKYKGDSAIQTSSSLQHASLQRVITSSKESVSTAMNDQTSLPRKDQINIHQEPTEQKLIEGQESNGSANVIKPLISNSLIVNTRQRGNPILKSVRSIPWEYGNIIPDYVMGQSNCALFLSLRYHQLPPNFIHERVKASLRKSYELSILLVQVDGERITSFIKRP